MCQEGNYARTQETVEPGILVSQETGEAERLISQKTNELGRKVNQINDEELICKEERKSQEYR